MLHDRPQSFTYRFGECRVVSLPDSSFRTNQGSFAKSTDRGIVLERDPQNKLNRDAVKVIGLWQDENGLDRIAQIGWLPSDVAYEIAVKVPDAPVCADIVWTSETVDIRGPHIRIAIWYLR